MSIKKWLTTVEGEPEVPPVGMIVLCLILSIAVAAVEAYMINRFRAAQAAESWPQVQGVVMRSSWVQYPGAGDATAELNYQYIVAERLLQGEQVKYGDGAQIPKAQQQATLDRYPVESAVQVYYNPDDPAEACLERGIGTTDYVTIVAPLVFAILMTFATIEMYRMRRRLLRR